MFSLRPLSIIFTMLWIVGVINAMNLIDGLDGLAAGVGLFGVTTTFVMAASRDDAIKMLFMAALGGSLLGFLVYNFNPASIFMGDTGSMFIGCVLAVGSIQTSQKSSTAVAILIPLASLGLPIADTLLAMIRRAVRAHIHRKLMDLGLTQKQAVFILYGPASCSAALAPHPRRCGPRILSLLEGRSITHTSLQKGQMLEVIRQKIARRVSDRF